MPIGWIWGLIGVLALVSLPFVLEGMFRSVSHKLDRLLEETKRDGAVIHTSGGKSSGRRRSHHKY